jgi:hypothetical protein
LAAVHPAGQCDQNEPERVEETGHNGSRRSRSAHTSISHRICRIEFPDTTGLRKLPGGFRLE